MGESGKEIPSRNSHSMAVIHAGSTNYLVVFGGASPESGPMGDTFYAELPDESDIGDVILQPLFINSFYFSSLKFM